MFMHKASLFGGMLGILILVAASLAHAGPTMAVEAPVYEFGTVNEGALVEHTFTVLNRGNRELIIEQVKADCGCTTADFDRVIPPGGEGRVTLKLDTKGYRGTLTRNTRVFTNDPDNKMTLLKFTGTVHTPIVLSKGHVIMKGVAGQRIKKSIEVRAAEPKPLKIEPVSFDLQDKVDFRIEEVDAGKAYRILFETRPELTGHFHGILKLKTNYSEKPEISIRIRGRLAKS